MNNERSPRSDLQTRQSLWCVVILLLLALRVGAREGPPPISLQRQVQPQVVIQQIVLPPTVIQVELAADTRAGLQIPVRFAVPHRLQVTPATHGTWEQLPDGRLWRLRIISAGATDLNMGFSTFWLPEGATLHVSAVDEPYFEGPYSARDNQGHGQFWTPIVPGEAAVLELFVPTQVRKEPQLVLTHVGAGYRDMFHRRKDLDLAKSGACNIDVVCPAGAAWSNEIRSVALYSVSGITLCTGTLIADAAGDFRDFFLTANHCGVNPANAASVVVYWNFQSPACGQRGGGSLAQNQSGAIFRAAGHDVDFALIELDEKPEPGFHVYYSGWDRAGAAPSGVVGIHHAGNGEKAISISPNSPGTINNCIATGGTNTHWEVIWTLGITEQGSSGSAIWDSATHRVVGTLSGGGSSCFSPMSPDCYGKLSAAWDSGMSPADRLQDWLDPLNSGVSGVAGADPMQNSIIRPAGAAILSESCYPTNGVIDPGETVTVSFTFKNLGGVGTTNLVATLLSTSGVVFPSAAQNYGGLTRSGPAACRTFTFGAEGVCGGRIATVFHLQDGTRELGTVILDFTLGFSTPAPIWSEDFDSVVAPALPAGWSNTVVEAGDAWATSTAQSDTPPNAVFAADPDFITDNWLISPSVAIHSADPKLTFRHSYDLEDAYDGGVLEISINGAAFADILSAGGSFVTRGYNRTLSTQFQNPLGGRMAWSGNSGGFVTTTVNLPPSAIGGNVQLRWRLGSDNSASGTGWHIDGILLTQASYACCSSLVQPRLNAQMAAPGSIVLSYDSVTGQTYFIETSISIGTAGWSVLQTNSGDGSRLSYTNSMTQSSGRFFRVRTQ